MKFLIIALIALLAHAVSAHNVLLHPRGKACFYETLKKGDRLSVTFQVGNRNPHSTDQLTADFWIMNPHNVIVEKLIDVSHGDVSHDIKTSGKYEYCFSNENSLIDTKDVTFNIHGVVYVDASEESNSLDAEVKQLGRLIQDVKNEQGYIVIRERVHRNTAESTNSRVKWWSLFQLIVVAVNSIFQIYYLRRFFEVKTVV